MNDVVYRINTALPVRGGTVVVNNGSLDNLKATASGSVFHRDREKTFVNENPVGTGYVNRFDDPTYYAS